MRVALLSALFALSVFAQTVPAPTAPVSTAPAATAQTKEFDLKPSGGWIDTGLDLQPGDSVRFTATGQLQYSNAKQPTGPQGLSRGWADLIRQLPVNEAGRGAVVGRIGSSAAARAFLIGEQSESLAPIPGRLFLSINQGTNDSATGGYHVTAVLKAAVSANATKLADIKVPPFPQERIDSIPRRVSDATGAPGDRTNFIVIGSQEKLQAAFKAAGWVTVDKSKTDAVLRGALATFSKQAYVTLPMSELMLYDRIQDFGYAQGDPVRVVASRHHFRIWKAPFDLEGQTVWVGAGTHDIGFDRDQRNNGITHKIDPDVDGEREYIRESLMQTGLVAKADYMAAKDPVTAAKTAHGEEFHSDGRTVLIYLMPDAGGNIATAFADLFCSVLKQNNPGGENWGTCSKYIESAGKEDVKLGPITNKYRVLVVPGILSSCVSESPAFQEGQDALKKQYNVDVELLPVPNDSSESNAKLIAQYLADHFANDTRKYIVIGYSKGAPDVQVALAKEFGTSDRVAGFITVAGASGGSPIADVIPIQAERYMGTVPLKNCKGDLATGFRSLKRETRQAFLAAFPNPIVPSYSLIAKSDATTTSKSLLQTWRILSTYGAAQDGQLLKDDAIAPGAKYLGAALADHFAIALPFDKSADSAIRGGMDKAAYPRAALLESLVRYVTADLGN
ncbi:MAG: LssY C-terminal domain-containing protein [Bryobacteraceae bacterium]